MRKTILLLLLLVCSVSSFAQRFTLHGSASTSNLETSLHPGLQELYYAGDDLQKSVTFEYVGLGCGVMAAVLLSQNDKQNLNNDAPKIGGYIFVALAAASEIYAISLRHSAGIELKVAAGSLKLTF